MTQRSRIASVLGAPLAALSPDDIHALVAGRVREQIDLDFKETLYGNGESERRDLAGDVAALLNTVGGALILGVAEDDGAAASAPGVTLSDAEELRMRQILAGNLAPRALVSIHHVEERPGHGFYVIEVPRSADAPHAVRVGDGLRYPRRDGNGIRWLSETEVADAYSNRFAGARAQIDRLDAVHTEGTDALRRFGEGDTGVMIMSLVPDLPGELTLQRGVPETIGSWIRDKDHPFTDDQSQIEYYSPRASTAFRRVVVAQGVPDTGRPDGGYFQLHTDGSGFASFPFAWKGSEHGRQYFEPHRFFIEDEALVSTTAELLSILAGFALDHARAGGLAAVRVSLLLTDETGEEIPVQLVSFRGNQLLSRFRYEPLISDLPPAIDHTIDLEAVATSTLDLLLATRTITTDLFQALGRPSCWQIDPEGRIRALHIKRDNARQVQNWARRAGAEITDEPGTD